MQVEVVLNKNVSNLGQRGDLVKVRRGYFRNYLYPQGSAVIATPATKKLALQREDLRTKKIKETKENAQEFIAKLENLTLTFTEKASPKGKLYGAISEDQIIEAIAKEAKLEVPRELIKMEHIKETGDHSVTVNFGHDHTAQITVKVQAQ